MTNMVNKERLLKSFLELLKIKSPSKNEKEIVDCVSSKLEDLGLDVYVDDCWKKTGGNAGNIIAQYIADNPSGSRPIFLTAHLDTVEVNGDIVPVIKKGIISNKNKDCILGGDNKVAVAAVIEALEVIMENKIPTGDIYVVLTVSEEIGLLGSKNLDTRLIKAKYGFAFDGDGDIGTIINKAPYQNSIDAQFKGKSAHAGVEPEKGINSIQAAAAAINKMKIGRIDKETTSNVGKIEGGIARNIVPENTKLEIEARSLDPEKLENITSDMVESLKSGAAINNAGLDYKVVREYDGFEISENEVPVQIARYALQRLNIESKVVASGGGSDVNIFNSKGMMAINLSSGMENIHTTREFVKVDQLIKLAGLIIEICRYVIK
ncbi:MAG: M20/M25/M40 family metallo-hydrolase [Actinomycetota bacterium]|nr:M20/M25/M40 family metallo-hydrolase [Actinomycetota bacterium]